MLALTAFLGTAVNLRAQIPTNCINGGMASIINVSPTIAHVGDTITVSALGVSLGSLSCDVTNGQSFLMYPNGNTAFVAGPPTGTGLNGIQMYETNFALNQAHTITCLPTVTGEAGDVPGCLPITTTYVVNALDENKPLAFTTPRAFTSGSVPGSLKTVKFLAVSDGILTGTGGTLTAGGQGNAQVMIVTPCIQIVKLCNYPQGQNCFQAGQPIAFTGYVTNCGDVTLTNVVIVDNRTSSLFDTNGLPLLQPLTLAPGQAIGYQGSYSATVGEICAGSATNTVTVTGQDNTAVGGPNSMVSSSATVACEICVNPCLHITKTCTQATQGGTQVVSGAVTNCGNIALTNITVTDNVLGTITNYATLAPGSNAFYSTSFTATICGTNFDYVTASGFTVCGSNVLAFATNDCVVLCQAHIGVTKEVACFAGTLLTPGVIPTDPLGAGETCGPFSNSAVGVSGTNDPAFCYMITVTNPGPIDLTNVSIIDTNPAAGTGFGDLTADFPCVSPVFHAGDHCTFTFKATIGQDLTNIVNATGTSVADGTKVSTNASATVTIFPAEIECHKYVSVDGGPLVNSATLPDQNQHGISWWVLISNPSTNVNLANVVIEDTSTNLPCDVSVPPFSVDAGGSNLVLICTNVVACGSNGFNGVINTVVASANSFTIGPNHTPVCALDIRGSNVVVTTANEDCSATLTCPHPEACRVTGGGRQDAPNVFPANVRYITHGGQVGAPVGDAICTVTSQFPIGNPCIHGRWTHVRHMQGGLEGNFHARFYDTLQCACLDTNLTAVVTNISGVGTNANQTYTDQVYGPGTSVDAVCNPGNRIAGPEPSPAPANKIVFTGVGDYALTQGNRVPVSVLFRVDIEDRGEPGGSHPGGGKPPPDRNRTRIWILNSTELAELRGSGPDSLLLNFRNAISACNGINVQDGASVPNGTAAFGVRAPDIDDGGELDRGNYQIHPSILSCDPNNPVGPGLAKP